MHVCDLEAHLQPACVEVLETMFFSSVIDSAHVEQIAPGESDGTFVIARLHFAGAPSGDFEIRTSASAAGALAASFLGEMEPDITPQRTAEVICELTNMLCGSVLSRMNASGVFELSHPELVERPIRAPSSACRFELPEGPLEVAVALDSSI